MNLPNYFILISILFKINFKFSLSTFLDASSTFYPYALSITSPHFSYALRIQKFQGICKDFIPLETRFHFIKQSKIRSESNILARTEPLNFRLLIFQILVVLSIKFILISNPLLC